MVIAARYSGLHGSDIRSFARQKVRLCHYAGSADGSPALNVMLTAQAAGGDFASVKS
jgi:hypothetical protein